MLLKVLELAVGVQMDKVLGLGPKTIFKGEGKKVYKSVGNRRKRFSKGGSLGGWERE